MVKNTLLPVMREDEIYRLIRYDKLIIEFANKQCKKYKVVQHDMIRSRLRYLGKILHRGKEIKPAIDELADLFNSANYYLIVDVCNEMAGFNNRTNEYKSPAIALHLGTLIKKVANRLSTICIMDGDMQRVELVKQFLKVFESEYASDVNKMAHEQLCENQRKRKIILPSEDDIAKLWSFLNDNRQKSLTKLQETYNYSSWLELMEYTLLTIIVFNRRRVGDTEKITIEEFEAIGKVSMKTSIPKHSKDLVKKKKSMQKNMCG